MAGTLGAPLEDTRGVDAARSDAELALDIAQVIYDARTAAGMTQTQLATAMGVSQSRVSELEGGGAVPNLKTLAKVAAAVGRRVHVELAA
ncbi:MAG: helix-turn-helix domain-containing protein [Micrococcales bacterium]|nr:helix-turn-helix domain-containing protein [Micrococcales bacterium]